MERAAGSKDCEAGPLLLCQGLERSQLHGLGLGVFRVFWGAFVLGFRVRELCFLELKGPYGEFRIAASAFTCQRSVRKSC